MFWIGDTTLAATTIIVYTDLRGRGPPMGMQTVISMVQTVPQVGV